MTMSSLFSRTAIIPVWFIAFGLFAWSGGPMPVAMAVLMVVVALSVPVLILILWKEWPLTVAEIPHQLAGRVSSIDGRNSFKNSST
jgi:predicted membrane metal-binding protein